MRLTTSKASGVVQELLQNWLPAVGKAVGKLFPGGANPVGGPLRTDRSGWQG